MVDLPEGTALEKMDFSPSSSHQLSVNSSSVRGWGLSSPSPTMLGCLLAWSSQGPVLPATGYNSPVVCLEVFLGLWLLQFSYSLSSHVPWDLGAKGVVKKPHLRAGNPQTRILFISTSCHLCINCNPLWKEACSNPSIEVRIEEAVWYSAFVQSNSNRVSPRDSESLATLSDVEGPSGSLFGNGWKQHMGKPQWPFHFILLSNRSSIISGELDFSGSFGVMAQRTARAMGYEG